MPAKEKVAKGVSLSSNYSVGESLLQDKKPPHHTTGIESKDDKDNDDEEDEEEAYYQHYEQERYPPPPGYGVENRWYNSTNILVEAAELRPYENFKEICWTKLYWKTSVS